MYKKIKKFNKNNGKLSDVNIIIFGLIYDFIIKHYSTLFFYLKAKLIGVKLIGSVSVYGKVLIKRCPYSKIQLGKNVSLISNSWRGQFSTIHSPIKLQTHLINSRIIIGNSVGLNGTSIICRSTKIEIGDFTMIGPNVTIVDMDGHKKWPPQARHQPDFESDREVIIGRNCWIGEGSKILKGITIHDNAIVGAGSIVTKDVPYNSIVAGNPARFLRNNNKKYKLNIL